MSFFARKTAAIRGVLYRDLYLLVVLCRSSVGAGNTRPQKGTIYMRFLQKTQEEILRLTPFAQDDRVVVCAERPVGAGVPDRPKK